MVNLDANRESEFIVLNSADLISLIVLAIKSKTMAFGFDKTVHACGTIFFGVKFPFSKYQDQKYTIIRVFSIST